MKDISKFPAREIQLTWEGVKRLQEERFNPDVLDGWTPWMGGECPIADGTRFSIQLRGGENVLVESEYDPQEWGWAHNGGGGDVIAYRIEAEEEAILTQVKYHFGVQGYEQFDDMNWLAFARWCVENLQYRREGDKN